MRITQIKSPADFGWWCLDQAGHGAIVLAAVSWFATSVGDVAIAGAVILTIREAEQGRDTVDDWRDARECMLPTHSDFPTVLNLLRALHLPDRFGDVAGGVGVSAGLFAIWLVF